MTRQILDEDNQAVSEPTLSATEGGDAVPELIQYRGRHSSVTVDDFGLIFGTERRDEQTVHKPLPVATEADIRSGDAPANAVVLPVAVELVERNNLFGFGVTCEHTDDEGDVCGKVFQSRKKLDGHKSSHTTKAKANATDTDTDSDGDSE